MSEFSVNSLYPGGMFSRSMVVLNRRFPSGQIGLNPGNIKGTQRLTD
jgi:enamine deaminase RidA (YjgF/YER057c/UK114 family)